MKIYFRYGAMGCGKSLNLLSVAHNYEDRGMRVLIIKPHVDTKGSDYIVSRLGVERKADHIVESTVNVYILIKKVILSKSEDPIRCVLVDEAQFLTPSQVDQLMQLTIDFDIPVICYGLRTDFMTDVFEGSQRLLAIAQNEELVTVCSCGKKAVFNARKVNGEFVFHGEQISIDNQSNVEYISLCPKCYYREKAKEEAKNGK